jgi:hypothetical protein
VRFLGGRVVTVSPGAGGAAADPFALLVTAALLDHTLAPGARVAVLGGAVGRLVRTAGCVISTARRVVRSAGLVVRATTGIVVRATTGLVVRAAATAAVVVRAAAPTLVVRAAPAGDQYAVGP